MVSGGYGDVWFATLDQGTLNSTLVAVKELRQVGNGEDRARVSLVSLGRSSTIIWPDSVIPAVGPRIEDLGVLGSPKRTQTYWILPE